MWLDEGRAITERRPGPRTAQQSAYQRCYPLTTGSGPGQLSAEPDLGSCYVTASQYGIWLWAVSTGSGSGHLVRDLVPDSSVRDLVPDT